MRVYPILVLALAGLQGQVAIAGPPTVQELVTQFSATNYLNIVSNKLYTRQGMNRAPVQVGGTQHDLCRDAIYEEFKGAGLSPYKDPFSYVDTVGNTTVNVCNIIAANTRARTTTPQASVASWRWRASSRGITLPRPLFSPSSTARSERR